MTTKTRHILSLSGGKDSAALAIYMRDKVPEMEYIFHDTEKELPETYEYLARLEAILGGKIQITTPDVNFDHWLTVFGGMIPSKQRRWCTKYLKLKPFEKFVGDDNVVNYIGIRADEERAGYISHKSNITPSYPFRENGLVLKDIIKILNDSGLGLPTFTKWGRTRSGCYFCFFQQKIEWVRLKETYPDLFEKAKKYEYANQVNGNPFYWNRNEPLEKLEKPERMEEIILNWERAKERESRYNKSNRLIDILGEQGDKEIIASEREGCLICQT